jgi:hypothetical protein
MAEDTVSRNGIAVAVSLDASNAFNSIPWVRIMEVLRHNEEPAYHVEVIGAYLNDRWITFTGRNGEERRRVERGVPQGSVPGPILRNTAYDSVLRCPMPPDTGLVCYADDTMVLAGRRWWSETVILTEDAVACAVHAIQRLGLRVSKANSEALWFFDHRRRGSAHAGLSVAVNGDAVPVKCRMTYLGLTIDSRWTFGPHFELLVPRVTAAANALCGLLPNITGAGSGVRESTRDWSGPGSSMGHRCGPKANRRSRTLVRRLQRMTAIRIARGYRTISYETTTVLAASPPIELRALELCRVYERLRAPPSTTTLLADGLSASNVREEAKLEIWERWRSQVTEEVARRPHRAVRAVLPNWQAWRDQGSVPLTFRATQMLNGHGVFGEYLMTIGREVASIWHQRREEEHTLEFCPAWAKPQRVLQLDIAERLAPEAVVKAMLLGPQDFNAVRTYYEEVMQRKERAKRRPGEKSRSQ